MNDSTLVVIKDSKITAWRDYLDPLRVFAALEGAPLNQTSEKRGDDQQATFFRRSAPNADRRTATPDGPVACDVQRIRAADQRPLLAELPTSAAA